MGIKQIYRYWYLKLPVLFATLIIAALLLGSSSLSTAGEYSQEALQKIYMQAFGGQKTITVPSSLFVDLRVNGVTEGSISVHSSNKKEMDLVKAELLLELFKPIIKETLFDKLEEQIGKQDKVAISKLVKLGYNVEYNPITASLDFLIDESSRLPRKLSMRSKPSFSVKEENKLEASTLSGYLNLYSNLSLNQDDESILNLRTEANISLGGLVLESKATINDNKWNIQDTKLTYDLPENLQRYSLGDISTQPVNFQKGHQLTGLKVSKEFYIDPDMQIRPKAGETFILKEDSTVEVFTNDHLQQTFYLRKGVYLLEDIGLYVGANNIRLKITDQFGKITEKNSEQFYSDQLLKQGLSNYAFNLGIEKNISADTDKKDAAIISGNYQYGVSDELTLGIDAELKQTEQLLGAEIIAATPLGSLKQGIALSNNNDDTSGYATQFSFKPNRFNINNTFQDRTITSMRFMGEYRSKDFLSTINDTNKSDKSLQTSLQGSLGLHLGDSWSASLNTGISSYHSGESSSSLHINTSKRFNNNISLSLGASYEEGEDVTYKMQLSIPLSKKKNTPFRDAQIAIDSKINQIQTTVGLKPSSYLGSRSLSGTLRTTINDKDQKQNLEMRYLSQRFEARLQASANKPLTKIENTQTQTNVNIGFNTSLVCAGLSCGTTYPVNDSFIIVDRPKNQQHPIAVNNGGGRFMYSTETQKLPDKYHTVIDGLFRPGVVHLNSYRKQNIHIDETNMPQGYNPDKTQFEVFPRYKSGYAVKAGGMLGVMVEGIIKDQNNKPASLKGGQLVATDDSKKSFAFFTNSVGRFRLYAVQPGEYTLELISGAKVAITIPEKEGGEYNPGDIIMPIAATTTSTASNTPTNTDSSSSNMSVSNDIQASASTAQQTTETNNRTDDSPTPLDKLEVYSNQANSLTPIPPAMNTASKSMDAPVNIEKISSPTATSKSPQTKDSSSAIPPKLAPKNIKAMNSSGLKVEGIIRDTKKQPMSQQGGSLASIHNKTDPMAFLTDAAGKFQLYFVPPGEYYLKILNGDKFKSIPITIPNQSSREHDIGDIIIQQKVSLPNSSTIDKSLSTIRSLDKPPIRQVT